VPCGISLTLPALLVLWFASTRVELVNEVYSIPAADWKYLDVDLRQQPVSVDCEFQALAEDARVRVGLIRRENLRGLRRGRERFLHATELASRGSFHYTVREPGEYAVVVDNRSDQRPRSVQLRVSLDFALDVRYLSRQRQLAVILISFAVFFGIVTYSARKLLRAVKNAPWL